MSASYLTKAAAVTLLTLGVVGAIIGAQVIAGLALAVMPFAAGTNRAVLATVLAVVSYALALALVIGVPLLFRAKPTDTTTLGIARLPSWGDIGLGILSMLPYYLLSGLVLAIGVYLFNAIDPSVQQQIPFENLVSRTEYVVAFLTLVVLAPLAEELLFRGYFFGKLTQAANKWAAIVVTSVVFGLLHVPAVTDTGVSLQWAAGIDTFAMGLVAATLRAVTGSIWAGVLLHSFKNAVAYYFLFISPL